MTNQGARNTNNSICCVNVLTRLRNGVNVLLLWKQTADQEVSFLLKQMWITALRRRLCQQIWIIILPRCLCHVVTQTFPSLRYISSHIFLIRSETLPNIEFVAIASPNSKVLQCLSTKLRKEHTVLLVLIKTH